MLQTNVSGALYLTKRVCEGMIERALPGSVIFITSIHQWVLWGEVGYSACKAALGAAVRELAFDLAAYGIRVNGIAPGAVGENSGQYAVYHPPTPLHHEMVSPSAIGRAAVFLASDYFSRHITGTILAVDGGLSLHSYLSRE
jgi:NAD(P)-dependent dehydrogenase (short-subunit alcohol dehydrogenase family)